MGNLSSSIRLFFTWFGLITGKLTLLELVIWVFLCGCEFSNSDLLAEKIAEHPGPNCASCHGYPLLDTNHTFHLYELDSSIVNDRPVTCLHCHVNSIAGQDTPFEDSIFQNPSGREVRSLAYPGVESIRAFPLIRVDTVYFYRPVLQPPRPGPLPEMQELQTSSAHLNGEVDIDFNETSIDTFRFVGRRAVYDVKEMTCSAVACHPNDVAYRWARPSKGLPMVNGDPPIE